MALDLLNNCTVFGPALPEPFIRFELEKELSNLDLLPKNTGAAGKELQERWDVYRRKLKELAFQGGSLRVHRHVIEPLAGHLGYSQIEDSDPVQTREGPENGGVLLVNEDSSTRLRAWSVDFDLDLDAPSKRGAAYRYSHLRVAQRVLATCGERVGLLTNGSELRFLLVDPARPDSYLVIPLDSHWKRTREVPDSFRLVLALASPRGIVALPKLVDTARLQQSRITKDLRGQARRAVEFFIQEILDRPENQDWFRTQTDRDQLARQLWREGLVTIYRLLFIFKLESVDDVARSFGFASTSLWRNTYSPTTALARWVEPVLKKGESTGNLLESGLRTIFRMFSDGLECTEMVVKPLGGALFGTDATPLLQSLCWGERAVAYLLDQLLWTPLGKAAAGRARVHYGPLDVEDLGRVYEALLELEPGITTEPMCRLRRQKLEVVVPLLQGAPYRSETLSTSDEEGEADTDSDETEESPGKEQRTKVEWIEEIPEGRFFLRVGLGRKATGSYYTPHSFVRFLVQETLGPQVNSRSSKEDPNPLELLNLKVLDPAMGSGHFLVEACRFLGEKLYEACRLCDELASEAEKKAESVTDEPSQVKFLQRAEALQKRVIDLPDPDDELVRYLPSRAPEGIETGVSQRKAEALCRRMVAVHCLYGVDKNPLAVELAKLSLWLESHAEGMPLTFLDHRLVLGDSLTGPGFGHLLTWPNTRKSIEGLFVRDLRDRFLNSLQVALHNVKELEATVGISLGEITAKQSAKEKLDQALHPFKIVAAAWAGGVLLGENECDDVGYGELVRLVARQNQGAVLDLQDFSKLLSSHPALQLMIARGLGLRKYSVEASSKPGTMTFSPSALPYELTFPEVFFPNGNLNEQKGFDGILGNPPWDALQPLAKEFFAGYDFSILAAPTRQERTLVERKIMQNPEIVAQYEHYISDIEKYKRFLTTTYQFVNRKAGNQPSGAVMDLWQVFAERAANLIGRNGYIGVVLPSAFHANESATGIRQLYLERLGLKFCYSFENRRKLFEIHRSFKFATVVAEKNVPTLSFSCAFYLQEEEWLFAGRKAENSFSYTLDFVKQTGGDYFTFLELQSQQDLAIANTCFLQGESFGKICNQLGIKFGVELDMSKSSHLFTATSKILSENEDPRDPDVSKKLLELGFLVLHEGKTFHQFTDKWDDRPRYLVKLTGIVERIDLLEEVRFYRLSFRSIARSTDERTCIISLIPPGSVFGNSAPCERRAQLTKNFAKIWLQAICSTFPYDWILRLKSSANINLFIINGTFLPKINSKLQQFYCHSTLRLISNHQGYESLWREQVGDSWREPQPPFTWPVLAKDTDRWQIRAAIDASVADAYGLNREQYVHVLSTFSHKSYPAAPNLCLAMFDELQGIGLEAFTQRYDPYHDVPLNESLPKPVINIPIPKLEDIEKANSEKPARKGRKPKSGGVSLPFES